MQYFCGYLDYDDSKLPFDPSLMVYFRNRLTLEIPGEINEMILSTVQKETPQEDDDDRGNGGNRGTVIVDATCAPSNIRYPQDASLLNEARENTKSCWTSCMIRPRLGNSCAIWLETWSPLTERLLWAEPFPNEKATVSQRSGRSMSSRSTCTTNAATRFQTESSASASLSYAPLCGARRESP